MPVSLYLVMLWRTLSLSLSLLHVPLIAPRLRLRAPPLTFTSHRLTYEPLAALFQPPPIPRLHRLRNVISNVTLPPLLPNLDHLTSVSMLLSFRDPQPKLILVAVDEREGISEERKIGRKIYIYICIRTYVWKFGGAIGFAFRPRNQRPFQGAGRRLSDLWVREPHCICTRAAPSPVTHLT